MLTDNNCVHDVILSCIRSAAFIVVYELVQMFDISIWLVERLAMFVGIVALR